MSGQALAGRRPGAPQAQARGLGSAPGSWAAAWASWQGRLQAALEELAAHPARLVWTLLVSLACLSAVLPLWDDAHAWWAHARSLFLNDSQVDYGEGPLFDQEVQLYYGHGIYRLDNAPPFTLGNYPPVFPLLASLLMHRVGLTFEAGRLVSSLAIVGASVVLGLIVLQATRQVLAAATAAGLLFVFPGIYIWGPWNRVDSLALFWSLLTALLVLRYAGTRKVFWAVPFAVLTVYTRQSQVDAIFAAYVYLLGRDWRRGLAVGLATAAAILAVFVGLQAWTHGAFYLNTVVDNENQWNWGTVLGNWRSFAANEGHFPFRLALAGAGTGLLGAGGVFWPLWLAGSAAVFATIGKVGAAINYFFPLYAATAGCAGVLVGRFRSAFRRAPFFLWPAELILPLMLFVFVHGQPPAWAAHVPLAQRAEAAVGRWTANRSQAGLDAARLKRVWAERRRQHLPAQPPRATMPPNVREMVAYLRTVQGPVLALGFPEAVQVQAGHPLQWQPFELGAAYQDGHWNPAPFVEAIRHRYYAVIFFRRPQDVLGYIGLPGLVAAVQDNYHYARTVAGWQVWEPDGPPLPLPPPPPPAYLPHPLADLAHAVGRGLASLPGRLAAALVAPRAAAVGPFREVDLSGRFNVRGIVAPGRPVPGAQGFDGGGNALSAALFPPPGTWWVEAAGERVPFLVPPAGGDRPTVLALDRAYTFPLRPERARAVWLLEAGVQGTQRVPVVLAYADGTRRALQARFTDWCQLPLEPEYPAYLAPYRLDAQGRVAPPPCGLFALRLEADPHRPLNAVTLGPAPLARLVALTVEKA